MRCDPRSPPRGLAHTDPSCRHALTHRIEVATATPNRSAAPRRDIPPSTAAIRRERRSSESDLAMQAGLPASTYLQADPAASGESPLDSARAKRALEHRWERFPLVWESVQGLFWRATGSLRAIMIPQLLFCFAYCIYVRRALGVPASWVILGFFACPMLLIHFEATYLDLASGLGLALMFFTLTLLIADVMTGGAWWSWQRAVGVIAMAAVAGNTKYQGLVACVGFSAIVVVICVVVPRVRTRQRYTLLALVFPANLAAGASALGNLVRHGNPVYPIQVLVPGTVIFDGPELPTLGAEPPAYLLSGSREISLYGPVNFFLSATELDWVLWGVAPWYNIDRLSGRNPRRGPSSRTGGWGSVFVLLNLGLLAAQVREFVGLAGRRQRLLVVNAILLVFITSCLPRAHDLRY